VDFSRPATHDAAYRWAHQVLGDVHGNATAIVKLTTVGDTVRVHVTAWNLTPGFHAIHIHQDGVCDPHGEKPFTSAGPHLNLGNQPEDMQAGVFPVLLANKQGRAQAEFTDGQFTIADLFGPTGSAIVIHALPDNYANIPNRYSAAGTAGPDSETRMTGDSGARIACGVIGAPKTTPSATPSAAPSKHT
jgi:Cu-Zn family superoxide dismutase